jgi:hypothetical protein
MGDLQLDASAPFRSLLLTVLFEPQSRKNFTSFTFLAAPNLLTALVAGGNVII